MRLQFQRAAQNFKVIETKKERVKNKSQQIIAKLKNIKRLQRLSVR